jgi:hypothetical protein
MYNCKPAIYWKSPRRQKKGREEPSNDLIFGLSFDLQTGFQNIVQKMSLRVFEGADLSFTKLRKVYFLYILILACLVLELSLYTQYLQKVVTSMLKVSSVSRVLVDSQPGQHLFNGFRGSNHLEERCDERLGKNLLSPKWKVKGLTSIEYVFERFDKKWV